MTNCYHLRVKLCLCLDNIEPITLNTAVRYGKGNFYKKDNTVRFTSQVNNLLRKYKNDFNKFNNAFDEKKHFLTCDYYFYKPILTKKDKRISKTSGDLSNVVKSLEDVVFKHLTADDSQVCILNVHKFHSENIRTEIIIRIKDLSYVNI
jgi:Holliday junction resolvase RusA-like endonuclease